MKLFKVTGTIMLIVLISGGLFYFCNSRIIKFYEKEPYALFDCDFTQLDTRGFIFEEPITRYEDYDLSDNIFNIVDYGAKDSYFSNTLTSEIILQNTKAINDAIVDASQNNGIALIPEGDFVSGTIYLKSNIVLRLEGNLIGSRNREHYEEKHFIYGLEVENVLIEGNGGKIMGEGEYFWKNPLLKPQQSMPKVSDVRMLKLNHFLAKREKLPGRPSPFIKFEESHNIAVRNVHIKNSPGWTLTFESSNNIRVVDTVLHNNIRGGNVDGIGIVSTSDVFIDNVFISTADDAIVLKNPKLENSQEMRNIHVQNVRLITTCNAFKIGTETYSDISNVTFINSEIISTEFFPGAISGIAIESVDGANVSDIVIDNITMNGVLAPLFIRLGNRNKYGGKELEGSIDDVTITNIQAINVQLPSVITGVKDKDTTLRVTNINISNFEVVYYDNNERVLFYNKVPEHPAMYPDVWMFGDVPAYGIFIRHADVEYDNITVIPRSINKREMIVINN